MHDVIKKGPTMTFLSGFKEKLRLDGWPVVRRAPSDLDTINEAADSSRIPPPPTPTGCPFGQVQRENWFSIKKKKTYKKHRASSPTSRY